MPINNIKDLREDLLDKYEKANDDTAKKDLNTFTQAASAIIRSLKVEMEYNKVSGDNKTIKFLEVE